MSALCDQTGTVQIAGKKVSDSGSGRCASPGAASGGNPPTATSASPSVATSHGLDESKVATPCAGVRPADLPLGPTRLASRPSTRTD